MLTDESKAALEKFSVAITSNTTLFPEFQRIGPAGTLDRIVRMANPSRPAQVRIAADLQANRDEALEIIAAFLGMC
jgi:hypothetical protein